MSYFSAASVDEDLEVIAELRKEVARLKRELECLQLVAWEWQKPIVDSVGNTIGYSKPTITTEKAPLPWWPQRPLYSKRNET